MRTSKKIVSLVLAVLMVATMMVVGTVVASAAGSYTVNGNVYTSLSTAMQKGNYITLNADSTENYVYCNLSTKKSVTIDLNGYTLSFPAPASGRNVYFTTNNYGTEVTIINGTVDCAYSSALDSTACFNVGSSTLIVGDGATIQAHGTNAAIFAASNSTVTVDGGNVVAEDSYAIVANGSSGSNGSHNYTINVEDGSVSSNITAIYHPNDGTLNISGGEITGRPAVYVKSGETNISGGTLKGVGADTDYQYNGNGTNSTGDALVVDNCNYPGGAPQVSVTGGNFESENGSAVASYAGAASGATAPDPVTGFVAGGTYDDNSAVALASPGVTVEDDGTGTFTTTVEKTYVVGDQAFDDFKDARNYARENAPATIKLLKDASFPASTCYGITTDTTLDLNGYTLSAEGYPLLQVMNGGNLTVKNGTIQSTGANAINVLDGSSLTIAKDTTVVSDQLAVLAYGGSVTVDKGGLAKSTGMQAIEAEYYNGSSASVTVNGAVEGVHGIGIYGDEAGNYAANVVVNGTVTASGFAIYSNGNYNYDYDITVNSGATVESTDGMGIYHCNNGTLTIKGGTVTGKTGVQAKSGKTVVSGYSYIYGTGAAKAYVHNNNGSSDTGDALLVENCNYPGGSPSIEIKGGTFKSTNGKAVASYAQNETYPEVNNFIKSGTFSSDVSDLAVSGKYAKKGTSTYSIATSPNKLTANAYNIEGYQQKIQETEESQSATGNDINTRGVRIVTKFTNTIDATDYGYVVAKYAGNKAIDLLNFNTLKKDGGNGEKTVSCVGTENNGVGTDNDHVTLAVNGMSEGDQVVARFYAVVDGVTYYSDYISAFGNANGGILASFENIAIG